MIMSKVRSKHTGPEMIVRKLLFAMGYRYRLHCRNLPGQPDVVMPGRKKIVDVRGCFWHGHKDCRYGVLPKSREEFWRNKIERNQDRDALNLQRLEASGWRVLVIWQCELNNLDELRKRLYEFVEQE